MCLIGMFVFVNEKRSINGYKKNTNKKIIETALRLIVHFNIVFLFSFFFAKLRNINLGISTGVWWQC